MGRTLLSVLPRYLFEGVCVTTVILAPGACGWVALNTGFGSLPPGSPGSPGSGGVFRGPQLLTTLPSNMVKNGPGCDHNHPKQVSAINVLKMARLQPQSNTQELRDGAILSTLIACKSQTSHAGQEAQKMGTRLNKIKKNAVLRMGISISENVPMPCGILFSISRASQLPYMTKSQKSTN